MIEFIDGEECCRWNGTLMTPEKCKEIFGIECEIDVFNDKETIIYYDGWVYSDENFGDTIKALGLKINDFSGVESSYVKRHLSEDILINEEFISSINGIKPLEDFWSEHLDFDFTQYKKFWNELNEYYDEKFRL